MAETTGDVETQSKELRQKKRMRCFAYVAAFVVFQTVIILVFALTIMRIKSPKYRLRSVSVEDLTYTSSPTSPSFSFELDAEIGVKNTNFGHFKFDNSNIILAYRGTPVGEITVTKGRAKARSTKKMDLSVKVNSDGVSTNPNFVSDMGSGILPLTSYSKLNGKVHLLKVFKKKKTSDMNCTMNLNLAEKVIQDIKCK